MQIGVLALQGAFKKHCEMLKKLNCKAREVREAKDLENCSGLILPGGESTVMSYQLHRSNLFQALQGFAKHFPLFGTCAGLILMAKKCDPLNRFPHLNLLNIYVNRNAYGSQLSSFVDEILCDEPLKKNIKGIFIRAPQIVEIIAPVKVLAFHDKKPVVVSQTIGSITHLGATFHPELTNDTTLHEYFLKNCHSVR